jgi:PHP family Zn ribbon phosphoesterase
MYEKMIAHLGNEFHILLDVPIHEIKSAFGDDIAEALRRVRAGEMSIVPGYDGIFGKVKIFSEKERKSSQASLI